MTLFLTIVTLGSALLLPGDGLLRLVLIFARVRAVRTNGLRRASCDPQAGRRNRRLGEPSSPLRPLPQRGDDAERCAALVGIVGIRAS